MKIIIENQKRANASKIAKKILEELEKENKPLKIDDIIQGVGLSLRTVRYGLKLLLEAKEITKIPDFGDLRSFYYINVK